MTYLSKGNIRKNSLEGDHTLNTTSMLKVLTRLDSKVGWTSDWLHKNIRVPIQERIIGLYVLTYVGQPNGVGTEHYWRIYTQDDQSKIRLDQAVKGRAQNIVPIQNFNQQNSDSQFNWNGLLLRSPAEQKIAEVLNEKGILFFANARCRIKNRTQVTETKETDFLIFYKNSVRVLEVDGKEFHQSAANDHKRDRLFERYGLRTTRFTASECLNNPIDVVDEFLEFFDVTNNNFDIVNNNMEKYTNHNGSTENIKTIYLDDDYKY